MKTVLIIEDNLEIRENTAEILELAGFKVINAENGKVGLTLAERSKPDIILCDIMMPEVNGYEVIRELKNNPVTSSIPFIYVTASGEKKEVEKAMGLGANGYVRKPFDTKELLQAIDRCSGAPLR
ncbi:MAG TPA: response regulator [Chryseosolibacter sp.]